MLREWKGPYSRKLAKKLSERGRRMAKARWDKYRSMPHIGPEPEPKKERWFPLEFGVRDKRTGETAWTDLRSVRHAAKALGLILKFIAHDNLYT